jgi:hypothetical protein
LPTFLKKFRHAPAALTSFSATTLATRAFGLRKSVIGELENIYSARIGLGYRALGVRQGSTIVWFWIGSHADYDRLV